MLKGSLLNDTFLGPLGARTRAHKDSHTDTHTQSKPGTSRQPDYSKSETDRDRHRNRQRHRKTRAHTRTLARARAHTHTHTHNTHTHKNTHTHTHTHTHTQRINHAMAVMGWNTHSWWRHFKRRNANIISIHPVTSRALPSTSKSQPCDFLIVFVYVVHVVEALTVACDDAHCSVFHHGHHGKLGNHTCQRRRQLHDLAFVVTHL